MSKQNPTWISDWKPEDETFWNTTGKVVARRNLIWSIVAEHIGFSVWLIWSIVATKLPAAGFHNLMLPSSPLVTENFSGTVQVAGSDALGDVAHHGEIMGDEDEGEIHRAAQLLEDARHGGLAHRLCQARDRNDPDDSQAGRDYR